MTHSGVNDVHRDLSLRRHPCRRAGSRYLLGRGRWRPTSATGAHVRLEATINLARILGLEVLDAQDMFDAFLQAAKITVIPITDAIARRAVEAFAVYGKGKGHPAQLDFADCLSYACADTLKMPILFKGRDFVETNLKSALSSES
ncbi:type II toxin-antitoxin system VapC family toxin [Rhizobium sp. BR 362]|uniref:type II toxin-antitoxin system VapC family toxin n=1 Tax=Rhizobium sp. BR 362 TaxID=3040670 RepID=UPI002F408225